MFMRYNHLGVGHSEMLRKITRNCLGPVSAVLADPTRDVIEANEDDTDREESEAGDDAGYGCNNDMEDDDDLDGGYEEWDEESSDGELDEAAMEDDGDGCDEDEEEGDYDNHVSF
jgi:hypothetical protein